MTVRQKIRDVFRSAFGLGGARRSGTAVTVHRVDAIRSSYAPPQSQSEIRPIVEGLKRIDPLLDILWNYKAVVVERGRYSEVGKLIKPVFDGRWDVVRFNTQCDTRAASVHSEQPDRPYVVICTLTQPSRVRGILTLTKDGPYAPVGEWVLELMRSADAANVEQFRKMREKLWAEHDATEAAEEGLDESEAREALDRVHFGANFAGGVGNWQGKGADFAPSLIIQP